jgi:phosphatidate cytidylyltransferase
MNEFWKRFFFTFLMGFLFLYIIYLGTLPCIAFTLLVQARMFHEILSINQRERKEKQLPFFRYLPWYFLVVTMSFFTITNLRPQLNRSWPDVAPQYLEYVPFAAFSLTVFGFVVFVLTLKKGWYRYQFTQFTWVVVTLLFINVQGSLLVPNMLQGMMWFLLPTSCVVMNDTWAYACGKLFGRTPLLRLSPKKTLEGFIGAAIFTTAWAWWFSSFLSNFPDLTCEKVDFVSQAQCDVRSLYLPTAVSSVPPQPFAWLLFNTQDGVTYTYRPVQVHALVLAGFASLVAPFGGFFASGFKRAFKLKDFSGLIPGHGGMTDRMDCQLIMGVFTYIYYVNFIRYSRDDALCGRGVEGMMMCLSKMDGDDLKAIQHYITSLLANTTAV